MTVEPEHRRFNFERFGKSYHMKIETAADLQLALSLDEAHWIASTAPHGTINADAVFLRRLDTDNDGRIRISEVKTAIEWLFAQLTETGGVDTKSTTIRLSAINRESPDGTRIYDAATKILGRIGKPEATELVIADVRNIKAEELQGGLDEAGIVLQTATSDDNLRFAIDAVLKTVGGQPHPNGGEGVTEASLNQFLDEAKQYSDWYQKGELAKGEQRTEIMPLGAETAAAYRSFVAIREKISQYFTLCDAVRLNPKLLQYIEDDMFAPEKTDLSDIREVEKLLERAPIAIPNNTAVLDLSDNINPVNEQAFQNFVTQTLVPVLGKKTKLNRADWRKINDMLQAHHDWVTSEPQVSVRRLPVADIRGFLADKKWVQQLRKLLKESHKTSLDLDNIRLLEKLMLYQGGLLEFANSFISFPHLYDPESRALFEMGTLVMDGRHFTLAVKAPDRNLHAKFSTVSNMFMLYAEIISNDGKKLYEVAVPVTSGNRGNLHVDKWGIFKDIHGQEHHAHVVQIVENPISLLEAIAAPFKRLGHAVTAKLEEMTNEAQKKLEQKGAQVVTSVKNGEPAAPPPEPEKPQAAQPAGGLLAGGGIAIAALGSSVAFITKTIADLGWVVMLAGVLGALLAVMLPAVIVAWLKLKRRDLSAILEGSGWGVNSRMRLNRGQSLTFTKRPAYPFGSKGIPHRSPWFWVIFVVVVLVCIGYLVMQYNII